MARNALYGDIQPPAAQPNALQGAMPDKLYTDQMLEEFHRQKQRNPHMSPDEIARDIIQRYNAGTQKSWDASGSSVPGMNQLMDNQMNYSERGSWGFYPNTDRMWEQRTQGLWDARDRKRRIIEGER